MRKVTLLMITLILSMSLVNADETTTSTDAGTTSAEASTTSSTETETETEVEDTEDDLDDDSTEDSAKKEELKKLREEEKARIEANREEMKKNREEFKWERGTWVLVKLNLTDDQKAQVKVIMDAHKAKMDEYKKAFEAKELTREELIAKVEELRTATNESLKTLLWDNEEALKVLSLKKVMLDKNMEVRKENGEIRKDFKDQRQALRVKYKEKFINALGTKLDTLSETKLNKVLTKIEAAIEKTTANDKLSEVNKNKILAQLEALKAIINEKLWITEEVDSEVNLDELFAE